MAHDLGGKVWERPSPYLLGMTLKILNRLMGVALAAALAYGAAAAGKVNEHSEQAQIAFDVPAGWVIANEQTLFEQGFIVAPEPLYVLVASPTTTPSSVALNPSAVPWLLVTVETDDQMLPPSQLYELAPQYLEHLASESGNPATSVKMLAPHHLVRQGGLSGSTAALTVVSPGGSTSLDEVAYGRGNQLWMVIAGCSPACYEGSRTTISDIVSSVKVGTAA